MEDDDRIVEAEAALLDRQRDAAIGAIRAGLDAEGAEDCIVCGNEIEAARRAAMPSATRCVRCQGLFERRGKA